MVDAAFSGAGRKAGMEMWRIEKLKPVKQPNVTGQFYAGDSYILLTTASKSGALSWTIHFWLGAETSQDEAGVAAYKSVELDESLGGGPVQCREVQGNESALFLSYFKSSGGVQYLSGGVESGFRKVERDVYETRLLLCKGKRAVRVTEVPVAASSLNRGDVFILDKGLKIFLFNGPEANKFERTKGVEVANRINSDERGGRAELVFLDLDLQNQEFWGLFGGYKDPKALPAGASDDTVEVKTNRRLFRISNASGVMAFQEVTPADGGLSRALLDDSDVFLLHASTGKIFVWVGKKSNAQEKREATGYAVKYMGENGLAPSTQIERVSSSNESSAFKAEFSSWDPPISFGASPKASGASGDTPVNIAELMERRAKEETPLDDGSGTLKVWVVQNFKKVEVSPDFYGQFFGGDSYILLYTYKKGAGKAEEYVIYFWLGNDSSADEKGAAALLTVELDDSLGGKPVQVRVTQGKEPAHFRSLFKGGMVVYQGGHSSGFSGASEAAQQSDVALFHVRGTSAINTVGVEVAASASSLNSQDCFCLASPSTVFVWQGQGANEHEIATAHNIAKILASKYNGKDGRAVLAVGEGNESNDFWGLVGGKGEYPKVSPGETPPRDPRLFSCSTATGKFKVEEVDNFDQSDLNDEDVFLLDTFTQVFVWVGSQSTQEEKDKAIAFAQQYVVEAKDGRDNSIPIIKVHAGEEPKMFSAYFLGWDAEYTKKRIFKDPYQMKLEAAAAEKAKKDKLNQPKAAAASAPAPAPTAAASSFAAPVAGSFTLSQLKEALPSTVDPTRKEEYLSDAEFQTVFGMDRNTFKALAKWKRDDAKKKQGIF